MNTCRCICRHREGAILLGSDIHPLGEASYNHGPCPRRTAEEGWEPRRGGRLWATSIPSYLLANGLPTLANPSRRGEGGGRVQPHAHPCLNLSGSAIICFINAGLGLSPCEKGRFGKDGCRLWGAMEGLRGRVTWRWLLWSMPACRKEECSGMAWCGERGVYGDKRRCWCCGMTS